MPRPSSKALKWTGGVFLALALLAVLFIALFDWNWLRGPIARWATEKTGRELALNGNLSVKLRWPLPRIRAEGVTFANPPWAKEKQMLTADAVELDLDLLQLLRKNVHLAEVHLERGVVLLELGADGRKNWLLDLEQQDENVRVSIDSLTLDHGRLGYDDAAKKTSIRSELSSAGAGVAFNAEGKYQGLALQARGTGGPVLALRDEATPYPLKVDATIGPTGVKADGSITSLLKFSAMDMRLALRGASLADLFPLLGIAFPGTRAYKTDGHLVHSGQTWRYEKFAGIVGESDIAGRLQVETGGKRPVLQADLVSRLLVFEDLGPLIGARPGTVAKAAAGEARVLPDLPFSTERWATLDADVKLSAKSIRRVQALPIENLVTHLKLRDAVLTLDPLDFGFAGGSLASVVSLDGRQHPIHARAKVRAKKLALNKLFPTVDLTKTSVGRMDGEIDLAGRGDTVGRMLAAADGKVGLVIVGGEISSLMMEIVGLDLWGYLSFKSDDKPTAIRCGVADFGVKGGVMQVNALVLDTANTNVGGTGSIDLRNETLALTLNPQPKHKSPIALRGPIHIRGTLARPDVQVDKARIAARSVGAIALAIVNPLLAILPLIETGPGKDSDCGQLIRDAGQPAAKAASLQR